MTAKFLVTLAQAGGFVVTPVLDGDFRNHSKRATTKRRAMREISRINAVQNRFKAISVSSKINSGTIHFYEEPYTKLEELSTYKEYEDGGYVNEIVKAVLQADSVLAYRKTNNMTHVICLTDTDFAALIGKDTLLLRGWKLKISASHSMVVKWTEAKYSIFAHNLPCVRALSAVAIGCDVFV